MSRTPFAYLTHYRARTHGKKSFRGLFQSRRNEFLPRRHGMKSVIEMLVSSYHIALSSLTFVDGLWIRAANVDKSMFDHVFPRNGACRHVIDSRCVCLPLPVLVVQLNSRSAAYFHHVIALEQKSCAHRVPKVTRRRQTSENYVAGWR